MGKIGLIFVLSALFLSGCQSVKIVDVETLDDYKGVYFEKGQGEPFTGRGLSKFSSGEKELEINLVNGLPHGSWFTWRKDGSLMRRFTYKEGKLVKFETFYPNGKKHLFAEYRNGKTHGKNIFWRPDGTKKFDVDFRNDKKHGKALHWHANGQLASEADYIDGKREKITYWDEAGKEIKKD